MNKKLRKLIVLLLTVILVATGIPMTTNADARQSEEFLFIEGDDLIFDWNMADFMVDYKDNHNEHESTIGITLFGQRVLCQFATTHM